VLTTQGEKTDKDDERRGKENYLKKTTSLPISFEWNPQFRAITKINRKGNLSWRENNDSGNIQTCNSLLAK
jgi:hypothetical protein